MFTVVSYSQLTGPFYRLPSASHFRFFLFCNFFALRCQLSERALPGVQRHHPLPAAYQHLRQAHLLPALAVESTVQTGQGKADAVHHRVERNRMMPSPLPVGPARLFHGLQGISQPEQAVLLRERVSARAPEVVQLTGQLRAWAVLAAQLQPADSP